MSREGNSKIRAIGFTRLAEFGIIGRVISRESAPGTFSGPARAVYDRMKKDKGNRFASKELEGFAGGVVVRDLVKLWNTKGAANNGEKIHREGDKSTSRYFLPT
jgi:hypothetical protein